MFKIIKTEYYDNFRCLMDKCKENCCNENWLISVDDDTYNRYLMLGVDDLDKKISADSHTIIKSNGKCPFILENGLCYWHKEYGEDYLPHTCRSYPRFVSSYGDLYIENIGLSCPASAKWIVELDHKCELVEQIYLENEAEDPRSYMLLNAEILMRTIINILNNNNSVIDGLYELYGLFEVNEVPEFDYELCNKLNLVFLNIAICYLFEHIMLESKNKAPNYPGVLNDLSSIINRISTKYYEIENTDRNDEMLAAIIYKTMREKDHIA